MGLCIFNKIRFNAFYVIMKRVPLSCRGLVDRPVYQKESQGYRFLPNLVT